MININGAAGVTICRYGMVITVHIYRQLVTQRFDISVTCDLYTCPLSAISTVVLLIVTPYVRLPESLDQFINNTTFGNTISAIFKILSENRAFGLHL